jgi:hypothetical protein
MTQVQFTIGEPIDVGWNGAKAMGNSMLAHTTCYVEAFGYDWVVVRSSNYGPGMLSYQDTANLPRHIHRPRHAILRSELKS